MKLDPEGKNETMNKNHKIVDWLINPDQQEKDWDFVLDAEVPRPEKYIPTEEEQRRQGMKWKVVGGDSKGGILVRRSEGLLSQQFKARLAVGTLVMALEDVTDAD